MDEVVGVTLVSVVAVGVTYVIGIDADHCQETAELDSDTAQEVTLKANNIYRKYSVYQQVTWPPTAVVNSWPILCQQHVKYQLYRVIGIYSQFERLYMETSRQAAHQANVIDTQCAPHARTCAQTLVNTRSLLVKHTLYANRHCVGITQTFMALATQQAFKEATH